jgi:hypothetical protein
MIISSAVVDLQGKIKILRVKLVASSWKGYTTPLQSKGKLKI